MQSSPSNIESMPPTAPSRGSADTNPSSSSALTAPSQNNDRTSAATDGESSQKSQSTSKSSAEERKSKRKAEGASLPGAERVGQDRAESSATKQGNDRKSSQKSESTSRSSVEERKNKYMDRKVENKIKLADSERISARGAQKLGQDSAESLPTKEDNNGNVPLAAEISDIHEENERLKRELEERAHSLADNSEVEVSLSPNIPFARVMADDAIAEGEDDGCSCRPTKAGVAFMVFCFLLLVGIVVGVVVSVANAAEDSNPFQEGSPQPSSPPTRTQTPSMAPSDTPPWLFVAEKKFSNDVQQSISNSEFLLLLSQSPNRIIRRQCSNCTVTHQEIYYKRITDAPSNPRDFNGLVPTDFLDLFLNNWFSVPNNTLNTDFELYSTYSDALNGKNRWEVCNYDRSTIGFPRDCAPKSDSISFKQWTSFIGSRRYGEGVDHAFSIENDLPTVSPSPTRSPVVPVPTAFPTARPTPTPLPTPLPTPRPSPTFTYAPRPTPLPTSTVSPISAVFPSPISAIFPPSRPPFPAPAAPDLAPAAPIAPITPAPIAYPTPPPTPTATYFPSSAAGTPSPSSVQPSRLGDPVACPRDMIEFEITLFTDFYGSETKWDLINRSGKVLASGGPYGDWAKVGIGRETGDPFCMPKEDCYSLNIYDEYKDGIASPGGFTVKLHRRVISSVTGGRKFATRAIDMATTVTDSYTGEDIKIANCEEVSARPPKCLSIQDFDGEEFLGSIVNDRTFSYRVTIGQTFKQVNLNTNSEIIVGEFESIEGNVAKYGGGDFCGSIGTATVEVVESSQEDAVQTFFTQPSNCVLKVEIRVPAC